MRLVAAIRNGRRAALAEVAHHGLGRATRRLREVAADCSARHPGAHAAAGGRAGSTAVGRSPRVGPPSTSARRGTTSPGTTVTAGRGTTSPSITGTAGRGTTSPTRAAEWNEAGALAVVSEIESGNRRRAVVRIVGDVAAGHIAAQPGATVVWGGTTGAAESRRCACAGPSAVWTARSLPTAFICRATGGRAARSVATRTVGTAVAVACAATADEHEQ